MAGGIFFKSEPAGNLTIFFPCLSAYNLMLNMILTPFLFVLSFLFLYELDYTFFIRTTKILMRLNFWWYSASKCFILFLFSM